MPWNEETAMSNKERFISIASQENANFSELCKEFMISRACGYKWMNRYRETGRSGLENKSRRPIRSPSKTSDVLESKILEVRSLHPAWGARKIRAYLSRKGVKGLPVPSTITRILHRNNMIQDGESAKHQAFIRFEHEHPNQLWQMDFKGHFATRSGRCSPLTILDDCSRYSLALKACSNQTEPMVRSALIEVFREYGMPERMTMDNGAPWGYGPAVYGFTRLEVWLIRLGIRVGHSRPYHPQTQGKDERFHRTLQKELLDERKFTDLEDVQRHFDEWRKCYNEERPHEAMKMQPPATRYRISNRSYPEILPPIGYDEGSIVRRVKANGEIYYKSKNYFISESMGGLPVRLEETNQDGVMAVYLCNKKVKEIDLTLKAVVNKAT